MSVAAKPTARLLIVDDEIENLKALERTLRGAFDVVLTPDPLDALKRATEDEFAVIVSDQRMPSMLGTELLARIAARHPCTTRVILTGHTDASEMLEAINRAEIWRYVTKPWDNRELVATLHQAVERYRLLKDNARLVADLERSNTALERRNREVEEMNAALERRIAERTADLESLNRKLEALAMTDALTHLANRRALFERFGGELERARRYGRPLSVAMVDVDYFKRFNDTEGHRCGDEALVRIGQALATGLRRSDVVGRYGGEEFLILMPETPLAQARDTVERLRRAVERLEIPGAHGSRQLTLSIGVAAFPEQGDSAEALVAAADARLYRAKEAGRNCVVFE
jgi:diguanylate cyclase (GGDEF)-like protein